MANTESLPADVPGVRSPGGDRTVDVQRTARIAGLKGFETPTLEQIERRRFELLGITFFILIALAVGLAVLSFVDVDIELLRDFGGTASMIRIALVVLAVAFSIYVADKERNLRNLSKVLINERVLAAALSNRLKEISLLTEAGKAVISTLELEDVLAIILNAAFELLEADEGSILLVEGDDLVVTAAVGHPRMFVGDRHKMNHGLSGYVARSRDPLLLEGNPDSEFVGLVADRPDIRSAMSVPLEAKGELLGVLNINATLGDRWYNEYDLRALGLFAEHAAMAIRHARILRRERDMRMHIAELDRVRAELVSSMAHDLKTPLTTILGGAKAILHRGDQIEPKRRQQLLEAIEGQAQRLLSLVERLLEAARSQVRHLPLSPTHIDLVPQVETVAQNYASAHGRRIVVERESPRVYAYADGEAVEQVLANLLENAVKYTPPEGSIRIQLRTVEAKVVITVRDEGPGIAEEDIERLFMPFRRGQPGGAGVGLGLFIVSNLVRAMGGEITVESAPGEGTAFTFSLPVESGDVPAAESVR